MHRAVKINDIDLYCYIVFDMAALFFSTSHVNYARWMVLFALELLNLDITHPGAKDLLKNGAFSVRRSAGNFSRVGVDMALEQSINAHAKNKLRGIVAFSQSDTAVQRWILTSATKTQLVNKCNEIGNQYLHGAHLHKELRASRIKRDNKDMASISKALHSSLNPFDTRLHEDSLYNLKSGREASLECAASLLTIMEKGKKSRNYFLDQILTDPERFEQPIKRQKLINFASENFQKGNKFTLAKKVAEAKGKRDLWGRIVYLATKGEMNLQHCLSFPMTPNPPSLPIMMGH